MWECILESNKMEWGVRGGGGGGVGRSMNLVIGYSRHPLITWNPGTNFFCSGGCHSWQHKAVAWGVVAFSHRANCSGLRAACSFGSRQCCTSVCIPVLTFLRLTAAPAFSSPSAGMKGVLLPASSLWEVNLNEWSLSFSSFLHHCGIGDCLGIQFLFRA